MISNRTINALDVCVVIAELQHKGRVSTTTLSPPLRGRTAWRIRRSVRRICLLRSGKQDASSSLPMTATLGWMWRWSRAPVGSLQRAGALCVGVICVKVLERLGVVAHGRRRGWGNVDVRDLRAHEIALHPPHLSTFVCVYVYVHSQTFLSWDRPWVW